MPFRHRLVLKILLLFFGIYISIRIVRSIYDSFLLMKKYGVPWVPLSYPRDWESAYSGWYNRSVAIKDTSQIHFNSSSLRLLYTSSSWGEEGFNLAMLEPDLCITNTAVLKMNQTDFNGFSLLANQAAEIKREFYNMMPHFFDISTHVLTLIGEHGGAKRLKAYGFDRDLEIKDADRLPDVLWELFGLVSSDEVGKWKTTGGKELDRLLREANEIKNLKRRPRAEGNGRERGFRMG